MSVKTCKKCGQEKPIREFWRDRRSKDGRHSHCKICRKGYQKQHYSDNKEERLRKQKEYNRKRNEFLHRRKVERIYGLSPQQYGRLLEVQNDRCAICKKKERYTIRGKNTRLAVDHDRKTGEVRGLLCRNCNLLIGQADHNKQILAAAIDYLNRKEKIL